MPKPSKKFKFGEWLPDQADLDNPGVTEAKNVRWINGAYRPYLPLVTSGGTLSGTVQIAALARGQASGASLGNVYVITSAGMFVTNAVGTPSFTNKTPGGFPSIPDATISQYQENIIVATSVGVPQFHVLGSGGLFANLTGPFGDAPRASKIGIIGQFVMLGVLGASSSQVYSLQWSGINAPFNWPTPNSADAIAQQSGLQMLDPTLGTIAGITNGDQWGMVLMTGGIVRITYVGGNTVFQFDEIYRSPGPIWTYSWIKVGSLIYFLSEGGFFVTDGTSVKPIGEGRVNQYYFSRVDYTNLSAIECGCDYKNQLIYWTLPKSTDSGGPQEWMAFNYTENKWMHVFDPIKIFVLHGESDINQNSLGPLAIGNNNQLGRLSGTPGTAVITSAEIEINTGGKTLLQGVMPQVSGSSPVITVRVGARNGQGDAVTFSPSQAPDAFTQSTSFLIDNRYHRAEVSIAGTFEKAIGGELDADPSSAF